MYLTVISTTIKSKMLSNCIGDLNNFDNNDGQVKNGETFRQWYIP